MIICKARAAITSRLINLMMIDDHQTMNRTGLFFKTMHILVCPVKDIEVLIEVKGGCRSPALQSGARLGQLCRV
jgi:hypothetical protein